MCSNSKAGGGGRGVCIQIHVDCSPQWLAAVQVPALITQLEHNFFFFFCTLRGINEKFSPQSGSILLCILMSRIVLFLSEFTGCFCGNLGGFFNGRAPVLKVPLKLFFFHVSGP